MAAALLSSQRNRRYYKNASVPWTPVNLTYLNLWMDGTNQSLMTMNGNSVMNWYSGGGSLALYNGCGVFADQVVDAPVYATNAINGRPALQFGSTTLQGQCLSSQYPDIQTQQAVHLVYLPTSVTGTQYIIGTTPAVTGAANDFYLSGTTATAFWADKTYTIGTVALNTAVMSGVSAVPNTTYTYFNGASTLQTQTTYSNNPNVQSTFGTIGSGFTSKFNGYIGMMIMCNPVSSQETDKIYGYMAYKFGLQNLLPANHPYKYRQPYTTD